MEEIIRVAIEKGLSVALSLVVLIFLATLIKYLPKWVPSIIKALAENAAATSKNAEVMKNVQGVFQSTGEIHYKMDTKIDDIKKTIDELKGLLVTYTDQNEQDKQKVVEAIYRLEKDVEELKKA